MVFFLNYNREKLITFNELKKISLDIFIIIILSFTLLFSFWVVAYANPFQTFLNTVMGVFNLSGPEIKGFSIGPAIDIINGNIYETKNTPHTYLFTYFFTRFPLFLIILFLFSLFILLIKKNYFKTKYKNFSFKIISDEL